MCEMKYLYEYCNMDECRQIESEEYLAEMLALNMYSNGKYPATFPKLFYLRYIG